MHLVMFSKDREPRAGVIDGEEIVDINACDRSLPSTLKGLLEANAVSKVRRILKSRKHRLPRRKAKLLPPIPNPGLLLSVAAVNGYEVGSRPWPTSRPCPPSSHRSPGRRTATVLS